MKIRIARPTDNIETLKKFYVDGLGLSILGEFQDHDGFDGIMIGEPNSQTHFEFTHRLGSYVGKAPTKENLAVFYMPDKTQWISAVERMIAAGFDPVASYNPYWDKNGKTFEDPDGYRVVLQNAQWNV